VFVSHDRNFINHVCTHVLAVLPDGRWQMFEGNLGDYRRLAKVANFPDVLAATSDVAPSKLVERETTPVITNKLERSEDQIKAMQKDKRKFAKDVEKLELEMDEYKSELRTVEHAMNAAGTDTRKIIELNNQMHDLQKLIDKAEEKWLVCSEELERLNSELTALGRG
jgi:ATPase subunit of ABC transporter with duplicated ATPase domains